MSCVLRNIEYFLDRFNNIVRLWCCKFFQGFGIGHWYISSCYSKYWGIQIIKSST